MCAKGNHLAVKASFEEVIDDNVSEVLASYNEALSNEELPLLYEECIKEERRDADNNKPKNWELKN